MAVAVNISTMMWRHRYKQNKTKQNTGSHESMEFRCKKKSESTYMKKYSIDQSINQYSQTNKRIIIM